MSSPKRIPKVLMIALDAAEPSLIEKWAGETLPNLKRLLTQGTYGRLSSTADWFSGSPWPSFLTGTLPSEHGLYHTKQWNASEMNLVKPVWDWLPIRPFWLNLSDKGFRTIAMDIPMKYPPKKFNGSEIYCWGTHDQMGLPCSSPPELIKSVIGKYGRSPLGDEVWGPSRVKDLLELENQLVRATSLSANLACELLRQEDWDLFIVGFGATHRGGHKLWDLTGTWGRINSEDRVRFSKALQNVYVACDLAIGDLLKAAGNDTTVIVFSLHGMGPNRSRNFILPEMLQRILNGCRQYRAPWREVWFKQFRRFRDFVPLGARYEFGPRFKSLTLRKPEYEGTNWASTPAFVLNSDLQGFVRINLVGRERLGIVRQGREYDKLCGQIEEGLKTFVDFKTGMPIVDKVKRSEELFKGGLRVSELPDLVVKWVSTPAAVQQKVVSPKYGSIAWPTKGRNPDGRGGNHYPTGFVLFAGLPMQRRVEAKNAHIVDLAPTVLDLFGIPKPSEMQGKSLLSSQ